MPQDELVIAHDPAQASLSEEQLRNGIFEALDKLGTRKRVLALPPDGAHHYAQTGSILKTLWDYYGDRLCAVMPTFGSHKTVNTADPAKYYPQIPDSLFRYHDWRNEITGLGQVPADFVHTASEGLCTLELPIEVNRLIVEGGFDLILSIGQIVPSALTGMANYSDNLFLGAGGKESVDRFNWLGAAYGIERILGRVNTPVRTVLDYVQTEIAAGLPVAYILTVAGAAGSKGASVQGLYIGLGRRTFEAAAHLAARINVEYVDRPIHKAVVWLDPKLYRSTWQGNQAIHRIRMAIADGGELLVIAPGIDCFGHERSIDETIRDYGYCGTSSIRALVDSGELAGDLAGAAHLAQGSTEGRFRVCYAPGGLRKEEIENAGYSWGDCQTLINHYTPLLLDSGWNQVAGEDIFFIKNPANGLWALPGSLSRSHQDSP
jgi:nickel-dependent lactate racemase